MRDLQAILRCAWEIREAVRSQPDAGALLGEMDWRMEMSELLGSQGCGRKIGPFDCCTVVCGDCLELMKQLPDGAVDAVITDPPYGIGGSSGVGKYGVMKWGGINDRGWDGDIPTSEVFTLMLRKSSAQIIWGGNYFPLPPSRCFLVWDKGAGFKSRTFAECEQAWCSLDQNAKIFNRDPLASGDYNGKQHPTQKPVPLMEWCIQQAGSALTILDPFAGSGTTLVAAKKLGRHFLGFEISEEYCRIARERIARVEAQPNLFDPKPEQMEFPK